MLTLNFFILRFDLFKPLEIVDHVFDFGVRLHFALTYDLVVIVQVADVLHEGLGNTLGNLYR